MIDLLEKFVPVTRGQGVDLYGQVASWETVI